MLIMQYSRDKNDPPVGSALPFASSVRHLAFAVLCSLSILAERLGICQNYDIMVVFAGVGVTHDEAGEAGMAP
jgi:hypothetical protein